MTTTKTKKAAKASKKNASHVKGLIKSIGKKSKNQSMIELAEAINSIVSQHGVKPTVLSKKMKKSLPYVYNMMRLANMSPEMKDMVTSGKIKGTDALKLLKKKTKQKNFLQQAEEIWKSKSSKKEASVEVPVKRSPGRPKKVVSTTIETAPAETPAKRRPGRPRKEQSSVPAETPAKRQRGRPKKVVNTTIETAPAETPAKRRPGRPRKEKSAAPAEAPVKRRRGRPRKEQSTATVQVPAKRGPGRPKKASVVMTEAPVETPAKPRRGRPRKEQVVKEVNPVKRPVGRPRKQKADQTNSKVKDMIIAILKKEKGANLKTNTVNSIAKKILSAL